MERLQRILAARGMASRRAAEAMITAGRVSVDGKVVTELGTKADPMHAAIRVDGKLLRAQRPRYIVLNKPRGYITTTKDERDRRTVMDIVAVPERVYPVGRLDRDTEGILLLTNDGDVANRVMHPRYELAKEYHVLTLVRPSDATLQRVRTGITVEGRTVVPLEVRILKETTEGLILRIVVHEGIYHLVRRMMDAVGIPVERLRRVRIGPLSSATLPVGAWRDLTPGELTTLREALHLDDDALPADAAAPRGPRVIRQRRPHGPGSQPPTRPQSGTQPATPRGAPFIVGRGPTAQAGPLAGGPAESRPESRPGQFRDGQREEYPGQRHPAGRSTSEIPRQARRDGGGGRQAPFRDRPADVARGHERDRERSGGGPRHETRFQDRPPDRRSGQHAAGGSRDSPGQNARVGQHPNRGRRPDERGRSSRDDAGRDQETRDGAYHRGDAGQAPPTSFPTRRFDPPRRTDGAPANRGNNQRSGDRRDRAPAPNTPHRPAGGRRDRAERQHGPAGGDADRTPARRNRPAPSSVRGHGNRGGGSEGFRGPPRGRHEQRSGPPPKRRTPAKRRRPSTGHRD